MRGWGSSATELSDETVAPCGWPSSSWTVRTETGKLSCRMTCRNGSGAHDDGAAVVAVPRPSSAIVSPSGIECFPTSVLELPFKNR